MLERIDPTRRGKGFALNFGFEQIWSAGWAVVVVLDADCKISAASLDELGTQAWSSQSPVQGVYLCLPPRNPGVRDTISGLAFRFKNLIRALGLSRLGGVCHLTGSGMAFPKDILPDIDCMGGHIVEDMQTGIALTQLRRPPQLCYDARIESLLPDEPEACVSQRTRWEHGHVQTMLSESPRLIFSGLLRRRRASICLGLDLAVPPLSLLVLSWPAGLAFTLVAAASGASWLPSIVLVGVGTLLGLTMFGRGFVFVVMKFTLELWRPLRCMHFRKSLSTQAIHPSTKRMGANQPRTHHSRRRSHNPLRWIATPTEGASGISFSANVLLSLAWRPEHPVQKHLEIIQKPHLPNVFTGHLRKCEQRTCLKTKHLPAG